MLKFGDPIAFVLIKSSDAKHFPFSRSDWNKRFNKRMNKGHLNIWTFVVCLGGEVAISQAQHRRAKDTNDAETNQQYGHILTLSTYCVFV
jgi:hypothetical protein